MEIISLIVLAVALTVRFLTARHTEALEIEKVEVDHEHDRLTSSLKQVRESRHEADVRLRMSQNDRAELEARLQSLEDELEELRERTAELEEN